MRPPPPDLLRHFALSEPQPVAETARAQVWKVRLSDGRLAALKSYPAGDMGNEASGFAYLRRCGARLAVAILGEAPTAVVMEWLEGPSLGDLARAGQAEAADARLACIAAGLFALEVSAARLLPVETLLAQVEEARFHSPEAQAAQVIAGDCLTQLRAGRLPLVALHGDLHPDNIIESPAGLRVFDAKGLCGPRAYELANAFRHPRGCPAYVRDPDVIRRRASLWARAAGCTPQEQLRWAIAKIALSLLWAGHESAEECALLRQMLRIEQEGLRG